MNKEKIERIKNKIKDNALEIASIATPIVGFVAFSVMAYKINKGIDSARESVRIATEEVDNSRDLVADATQRLRAVREAAMRSYDTGQPVMIYDEEGNPLFRVSSAD